MPVFDIVAISLLSIFLYVCNGYAPINVSFHNKETSLTMVGLL